MILNDILVLWYDEWQNGPTLEDGNIQGQSIQLTGVVGNPQFRVDSGDAWVNLTPNALLWEFTIDKADGNYSVELRDDNDPGNVISVLDLVVSNLSTKCGRANYIDIVNSLQITQTQLLLDIIYPDAYYNVKYYFLDSILYNIPGGGKLLYWADLSSPQLFDYRYFKAPDRACVGAEWTAYQPNSGSACDLVVASPTITQPNKGQSDGIIQGNATSSGNITYSINGVDFQSSDTFPGLPADEYTLTTRDDTGNCNDITQDIVLTEKYFRIAKLNAVAFVIPDSNRQNFNNTLLCEMNLPYRADSLSFSQTYFDDEILPVQFQSNFASHTVQVVDFYTKAVLATIIPVLIYDSPENFQYWEYTINLSLYSGQTIQTTIVPLGEVLGGGNAGKSEPLKVITTDENNEYVKVQWSSNKNHSDVYWQSGFAPFLYVRGQVASTSPQLDKEVSFDCQWNTNTQSRNLKRLINFQVRQQPFYVFEKLMWALGNGQGPGNFYLVNDVSVNSEDAGFDEPDFPDKFSLADSEAKLQERDLFAGDLSTTPTPVVTVNYLLVNPLDDGGLLVSPTDDILFV